MQLHAGARGGAFGKAQPPARRELRMRLRAQSAKVQVQVCARGARAGTIVSAAVQKKQPTWLVLTADDERIM